MRMCSRVVLVRVDLLLVLFLMLETDVREDSGVGTMVFVPIISLNRYLYIIIVANIQIQTAMLTRHIINSFKNPKFISKTSYNNLTQIPLSTFSNAKKIKDFEKQLKNKKKQSMLNSTTTQIPQHMKFINNVKKQTENLEVTSECQLENTIIINEIKRQRVQLEAKDVINDAEGIFEDLHIFRFGEKFLIGLAAINVGLAALFSLPVIGNNCYWLGMYSSCFLYPSLLFTTCAAIGTNLAYLIVRQGLALHTPADELKKIDITQAPISFYLQMGLLALQFYSLAISVSIPLTLVGLEPNIRNIGLYLILFFLLSANAHNTFQRRFFNNINYKIGNPSTCFIVLFLLSSFIHVTYSFGQVQSEKQAKQNEKFAQGQKRVKNMWKMEKIQIQDAKITDILTKQVLVQKSGSSNQVKQNVNTSQPANKDETVREKQKQKTNKIW